MFKLFKNRSEKPGIVRQEGPLKTQCITHASSQKDKGVSTCRLAGIAARCDRALMTNRGIHESDEPFPGERTNAAICDSYDLRKTALHRLSVDYWWN